MRPFLLAALYTAAIAAGVSAQPLECPAGNLLAGLQPLPPVADAARLTDGRVASEGAGWGSPPALGLGETAEITWDLGAVRDLQGLVLQGDANDRYPLAGSTDGRTWRPLGEIAALTDVSGLRTRTLVLPRSEPLRYLRLGPPEGDGFASVAELAAYCALPAPWPPAFTVEPIPLPKPVRPTLWNDRTSCWWELALALLGIAFLWKAPRRGWFALAAVVAALTYFNFGAFHFGRYIHTWDTLHYYLGAKYFPELSYDRLYECIAVADASASPRLARQVAERKITDLRNNRLGSTAEILAHPERCTAHFSPDRWRQLTADLDWFRGRETPHRWEEISSDHGFNGTPVWLLAGSLLANAGGPADDGSILALTLLDPLYFLALAAVIGWAFGLRPLAVALLVFATYFPSRFFWTGGAFLRWDWLFFTVASVACLKKGRPGLGGMALGTAAMLRLFPGLLAAGPLAALAAFLLRDGWRAALQRPEVRAHLRFLGGAALAAGLLTLATWGFFSRPGETYRAFLANTRKHQATPLTNHMGLRTVLAWRPAEVGRYLIEEGKDDPWGRWKEARLAAWQPVRPLAALLAAAALFLLGRAALRRPEPWIAAALGAMWIAFAVELTSYYYAFLIVPALLWTEKRSAGIALLALAAFSQWVGLAPLPGMPTWRDEQYTLISFATLLVVGGILWTFGRRDAAAVEEAPPRPPGKTTGRRS